MYSEDIAEILDHSREQIDSIAAQAADGKINKVSLKNTMENLRSVLDYMAQDILKGLALRVHGVNLPEKVYFPYGQRENHFKRSVKRNLPFLNENFPEMYDCLKSAQPFASKSNWLVDLCGLTNQAKHNNLSKTDTHKSVSVDVGGLISVKGAKNAVIRNNTLNGIPLDDVSVKDGCEVEVVEHFFGNIITKDNMIKFQGKELEIAPFLLFCHQELMCLAGRVGYLLNESS